jgi:hypothetical protein
LDLQRAIEESQILESLRQKKEHDDMLVEILAIEKEIEQKNARTID